MIAPTSPKRSSHSATVRGRNGTSRVRNHSAYSSKCTGPRYIFRFPSMWVKTKPRPMRPVTAITYFFPTAVR